MRVLAQWSRKLCNKIILILFKCARFYLCTLFLFGRHILQSGIHVIIRYSMMSAKCWCRIRALHLLSPSILVTGSSCDHSIKVWGLDTDRLGLHTSNEEGKTQEKEKEGFVVPPFHSTFLRLGSVPTQHHLLHHQRGLQRQVLSVQAGRVCEDQLQRAWRGDQEALGRLQPRQQFCCKGDFWLSIFNSRRYWLSIFEQYSYCLIQVAKVEKINAKELAMKIWFPELAMLQ